MQSVDKYEEDKRKGIAAAERKDNPLLKEIFEKVEQTLDTRLLNMPVTEVDKIQDIVRCKQLFVGLEFAIKSMIDNGKVADIQLEKIFNNTRKFDRGT